MEITEVKIRKLFQGEKLCALVSITIDGVFALHDIKIIRTSERFLVVMPSRQEKNGQFRDIAHPLDADTRKYLEARIMEAYHAAEAALRE